MIRRTKQAWDIGKTVKVGFLQLEVVDMKAVHDYLPDLYLLRRGETYYRFIPHHGLTRLEQREGWESA